MLAEAGRERGEQVEKDWEGGNYAVVAVAAAAVDSPPLLEMGEGRGETEEEEAEGMGRRRSGEKEKEMGEKGVRAEAQMEVHHPWEHPAFHTQALLLLPDCAPLSLSDQLPPSLFCLLPTPLLPPHIQSVCLLFVLFVHVPPAQVLPVPHPCLEHVPPPAGWAVRANPVPVTCLFLSQLQGVHAAQTQVVGVEGVC